MEVIEIPKYAKAKFTKRLRIPLDIKVWSVNYRLKDTRPYERKPTLADIYKYLSLTGMQLVKDKAAKVTFENLEHSHDNYSVLFFDTQDVLTELKDTKEWVNLKRLGSSNEKLRRTEDMLIAYMRLTINFLN